MRQNKGLETFQTLITEIKSQSQSLPTTVAKFIETFFNQILSIAPKSHGNHFKQKRSELLTLVNTLAHLQPKTLLMVLNIYVLFKIEFSVYPSSASSFYLDPQSQSLTTLVATYGTSETVIKYLDLLKQKLNSQEIFFILYNKNVRIQPVLALLKRRKVGLRVSTLEILRQCCIVGPTNEIKEEPLEQPVGNLQDFALLPKVMTVLHIFQYTDLSGENVALTLLKTANDDAIPLKFLSLLTDIFNQYNYKNSPFDITTRNLINANISQSLAPLQTTDTIHKTSAFFDLLGKRSIAMLKEYFILVEKLEDASGTFTHFHQKDQNLGSSMAQCHQSAEAIFALLQMTEISKTVLHQYLKTLFTSIGSLFTPFSLSHKKGVLDYIKTLSHQEQIAALKQALDEDHPLGQFFRMQRGFKKCEEGKGALKLIQDQLELLQKSSSLEVNDGISLGPQDDNAERENTENCNL